MSRDVAVPPIVAADLPVTLIRPRAHGFRLNPREIWEYRDLLRLLIWRDIKIRYKQTVIGVAWAVLQPVATMVVASILFGGLARIPSDGLPYPLFAFCALVPWTAFTHALTKSSLSVVDHHMVITKVYFPRLLIPLSSVLAALVDLGVAAVALFGLLLAYGVLPTAAVLALPLAVVLLFVTALGAGLWLAALNVEYRDIGNALPFLTQVWLFLTPVFYPFSLVPEGWRLVYSLNPMVAVVESFRWALLGQSDPAIGTWLAPGLVTALVVLLGGLVFYDWRAEHFADVV